MIPKHLAIILDGNGRWAKKRLMPHSMGHRAGAQTLRKLSYDIEALGIKYLTVYVFSTENWTRPAGEVREFMNMIREYFQQYIDDSKKNNMRMSFIGDMTRLDADLQEKLAILADITKEKTGLHVVLAVNYGGRDELARAAKKLACDAVHGRLNPETINEDTLASALDTYPMPDPDLIIRTGGDMRLSNFLLWQLAYAEMYVTDTLWPDFTVAELNKALASFEGRARRFGGRPKE
ncbi:MAG: polyprenyl diphosphate synthase [Defluviitaleaceae bacterium]|nr:polyprenyl diphosphate synthase [Defluviitaleaceae bacterium]